MIIFSISLTPVLLVSGLGVVAQTAATTGNNLNTVRNCDRMALFRTLLLVLQLATAILAQRDLCKYILISFQF